MKDFFGEKGYKKIIIAFFVTIVLTIITFVLILSLLNKKTTNAIDFGLLNVTNQIVSNENVVYPTSISKDKSINEVINETLNSVQIENKILTQGTTGEIVKSNDEKIVEKEIIEEDVEKTVNAEVEDKFEFISPVNGEILVDFAQEELVYSKTLEEWTTHLGIDIKADKTSVVSASEKGIVKSIKNDPRYGLTVTISHGDEFETVYSNLLSTDFISEGDSVEKGQAIGSVGESASFEISEISHLHFEMYKNGEVVNPTEYLK